MTNDKTTAASHGAVNGALEALFVGKTHEEAFGEIPAQSVQEHLADCAACRQLYDGLALADRHLADKADEPASSGFEASFGEAAFSAALDDLLAEEATDSTEQDAPVVDLAERSAQSEQPDQPTRRSTAGWYAAAAAVLLIGMSGWMVFGGDVLQNDVFHKNGDEGFQARSATNAPVDGPTEQPELELFCAQRTAEGVSFTGQKDAPFGLITCPLDAELKLAYRNTATQLRYAAFFGVDQTGKIYWYGPTPSDGAPLEVKRSATVEPVGESIRLAINHRPGRMRVVGVFSADPIHFTDLRRRLDKSDIDQLYLGERLDDLSTRNLSNLGTVTTGSFEVIEGDSQ